MGEKYRRLKEMNRAARFTLWTLVFVFIFQISVGSLSAQKVRGGGFFPTLAEDTRINPHDFTDEFYRINGITGKAIVDRRTGADGLSIFGSSSNPIHRNVRVIATMPAYDPYGGILFWYPLGELPDYGFTEDAIGLELRETAKLFPMYVFPHSKIQHYAAFFYPRQAAIMDNTWSTVRGMEMNPLGVRQVFFVTFTEKAYNEEGAEMIMQMMKKNGSTADDMPLLRTLEDVQLMMKHGLVSAAFAGDRESYYAIAPVIHDPTGGVIAKDAFLKFATKDGTPLSSEYMFAYQFDCLQKTGFWCKD